LEVRARCLVVVIGIVAKVTAYLGVAERAFGQEEVSVTLSASTSATIALLSFSHWR
jgi:hypothetical protein